MKELLPCPFCGSSAEIERVPATEQEPVAWRWKPKDGELWIYNPDMEWLDFHRDSGRIDVEPLYAQPVAVADVRGKVIEEAVSIAHEWADKMAKNNGRETANTIADRIRALQQQAGDLEKSER